MSEDSEVHGEVTCRVRKYEFVFILDSTLDDAAVAEGLEKYSNLIRQQGGEVTQQENWGRRKFAYDIRHKSEGSYCYVRFRGDKKIVDEINRVLRFDERVLVKHKGVTGTKLSGKIANRRSLGSLEGLPRCVGAALSLLGRVHGCA